MITPTSPRFAPLLRGPRSLFAYTLAMGLVTVVALLGLLWDPRLVTGAAVWIKPLKFAVSTAIFTATLLWLLGTIEGRWPGRIARAAGALIALAFTVEMLVIVGQAARGVRSHFNQATPLDAALFGAMGAFIALLWGATLVVALLVQRQRYADPALASALRIGLAITLLGAGLGFLMTRPTPEQAAALEAGLAPPEVGAHSVGVPDGGPGLPITGWSREGGDLRVPHFVGLHALQLLPLLAFLLARYRPARWTDGDRRAAVRAAGAFLAGLTLLLTWQALRGQSVAAPDGAMLLALLGLALGTLAALAGVALRAASRGPVAELGRPAEA